MMITPGTIIGERYEVIEKIGAGGMSIVYKARCNRLQRFVAIKVLREEFVTDEEFVAKFRKEALAAASLSHPNIVGIYDVGSDHDLHYIVMEYVEGKTLKDLLCKDGPFDSKTVLEFGVQIASALRHAHRKKIIHRDIKPQNILVTHDHVLKVTDFGIAKAVDSSTVVATGNAIGSVHYFSPEQAKGKYVNETSDLYSCGIVLFELATKKLPFEADSHISIALKHINEDLPLPSLFNPDIMPSLEKLILKSTHKSQTARYQDADEMLKDMKGILLDPNYVVVQEEVSDHTILMSALETEYLRNNGQKPSKPYHGKNPDVYTEMPDLQDQEENEQEQEVSTLYKVLVSLGGVLATLVLISIISVALVVWLPNIGSSKGVDVPNLKGKTVEEAEILLESLKLKLNVIGEEVSEQAEVGTIIKQNPGENSRLKANSVIEVTIVKEDDTVVEVRMPDLIGLDRISAEQLLNEQEILYTIEGAYDDVVAVGKIMDQRPATGQIVSPETKVTVTVSKGPQVVLVYVPNLANMTVQDAEISLRNEKLKLGSRKEEYSDTVQKDLIIKQSITPNKEVEQDTIVDVVVSLGKKEELPQQEETPVSNPDQGLVTKIFTLTSEPFDIETKDIYHIVVKLTTEDGSKIVFDQQVGKDQFPLNIPVKGRGKGTLDTYFDGKTTPSYRDEIDFNGV